MEAVCGVCYSTYHLDSQPMDTPNHETFIDTNVQIASRVYVENWSTIDLNYALTCLVTVQSSPEDRYLFLSRMSYQC